jgi:tetratricopeptide (TPR) repeat protein
VPARVTIAELRESLQGLLETDRLEMALRTVHRFAEDTHDQYTWIELRACLEGTVGLPALRIEPWVALHARTLRGCRDANAILALGSESQNPLLILERVWAMTIIEEYGPTLGLLEQIMPELSGNALGLAYRLLATIRLERDEPWESCWVRVREVTTGRALGIALLDEVYQHAQIGNEARSREVAREAIALLRLDAYHLAWAHHSIGMSYLREGDGEGASPHLLESERISRKKRAQRFRARALCGIGSLRRTQGDLKLAETPYRDAARIALEPDDLLQALWGLGHCLRLQGQAERALEQFARALRVKFKTNWIHVHRALAHLMLHDLRQARDEIRLAGTVHAITQFRLIVAHAELARLEGQPERAAQTLRDLPTGGVTANEECLLFPDLFALLDPTQHPPRFPARPPDGAAILERRVVTVHGPFGSGLVALSVSGRPVPIQARSKVGQLLRALLESGGSLPTNVLISRLWPDAALGSAGKRKQLWGVVRDAQTALGWRGAIGRVADEYRLDPDVEWSFRSPSVPGTKPETFSDAKSGPTIV